MIKLIEDFGKLQEDINQLINTKKYQDINKRIDEFKKFNILAVNSESIYKDMFENSLSGTSITSMEGELIECNKTFLDILNYQSVKELKQINVVDLYVDHDDRAKFIKDLIKLNIELEERIKERTRELAISEIQFRNAFEAAAHGMVMTDIEGRYTKLNKAFCDIVGYGEDELLNIKFQSITHPDDLDIDLGYLRQLLNDEVKNYHLEKRYLHKNGQIIWVLISVALIRGEQNEPLQVMGHVIDITSRKNAQDELAEY